MNDNKAKNPLKSVNIFFCVLSFVYVLLFILKLSKGWTLTETIESQKVAIIGFSLSVLFILCYLQKKSLSWWIAIFFVPIIFSCGTILENKPLDERRLLVVGIAYFLIISYLWPMFAVYKEYLENNGRLIGGEDSKGGSLDSQEENILPVSKNPLRIILGAAIISAIFAIYNILTGGNLAELQGGITVCSQQIATILAALVFALCYWKNSILAWWIALIIIPVLWLIYYIFQPFNLLQFIVILCGYALAVWYLITKYQLYRDYISRANQRDPMG